MLWLCRLGLQSDPRLLGCLPDCDLRSVGSVGSGARLGSLGGSQLRPRLPHVQQAPSSVPGPRSGPCMADQALGQGFRPVCHTTQRSWTALTGSNSMSFSEGEQGAGDGSNQQPRLACRVEARALSQQQAELHPAPHSRLSPEAPSRLPWGHLPCGCLIRGPALSSRGF